ncbi:MAG: DctP family TRAP transporter solute-binding subunit [Campylobacteraceae bacterium]|jgi:C4-dicarboxylate-binding protein DctP|nr:DctP family TRAP transporter solute-binding subunit [Campylobacteraceae bacterium]
MKKLLKGLIGVAIAATVSSAADYTIKVSHVVNANTPKGKAADFFAKRVGELTNGTVKVDVFPSAQLYKDEDVLRALQRGSNVQIAMPSLSVFTRITPEMQLFDLPFIFRDKEHLYKVMDGAVGDKLKKKVADKGFIAMEYWDAGFKNFSSSKKAILEPSDAKGQKFRSMSSKVLEEQFKAIGGNPQILPFSEVYSALQQGVVDAAENPYANFYNSKFHEVQSSYTLTDHGYLGYLVIISKKFWDEFPANLKPLVTQAMREATIYEREEAAKDDETIFAALKEYEANSKGKFKIYTLTDKQKEAWRVAMEPVYKKFYDVIGEDLIKETIATK